MSDTSNMTTFVIGGLPVSVFGLDPTRTHSPHGLAVIFLLHGRFGSAADRRISFFANSLISHSQSQSGAGKDLLVVTFDQRNHGERVVEAQRNNGWKEKGTKDRIENESHAVDMYSIQTGTARDVSFLIDFLALTIFKYDERTITDYFVTGISLGGHSTWLALAHDPRITLGIPIIGSPSILTLLSHRAASLAAPLGPLPIAAPYFPKSFLDLIERHDPVNVSIEAWKDKRILVLSGEDDTLVNYGDGGTDTWVQKLKAAGVDVDVVVQSGVGHALSPEMVQLACEYVWEKGLKVPSQQAHM
ncbi:hypothetical protein P7C70_g6000, partial [Phenoliferia sp. Uapishka_3]